MKQVSRQQQWTLPAVDNPIDSSDDLQLLCRPRWKRGTSMTDGPHNSVMVVEQIGPVERITLNRPEKRNALSFELQEQLVAEIRRAERSDDIRCIVIRGAGPSFCSGYDITPNSVDSHRAPITVEEDVALVRDIADRWAQIWNCRVPVIAQVHGYCVAGGTDLALHCDMVIVADDALIGFPPVRAQGGPPTQMWVYHAGPQWSKRLLLTGDLVTGSKAAEIGLALESVPATELDEHVMALAQRVASIGKGLLAHNKRIVNLGVELMGRSRMQVLAGIHDALGHLAPEAAEFNTLIRMEGVRAAVTARDAAFKQDPRR
jgi:enoyl-CoA hydratase